MELIRGGEGITVEFKRSRTEITKDIYETVCAFSNRNGGHIFLGVKDNGEILGVEEDKIDRLLAFGKKHLNDTFYLDGVQSVSARDHILREIISNLLAHRDFSNAYVAKLVIEKNRIYTENANLSHGYGLLNPVAFEPFPKNPPISKIFREIGLADELGSGMRNTYKYTEIYSGGEPQFIEGDIFRISIPLSATATATVGPDRYATAEGTRNGTRNGTINLSSTEEKIFAAIQKKSAHYGERTM